MKDKKDLSNSLELWEERRDLERKEMKTTAEKTASLREDVALLEGILEDFKKLGLTTESN